MSGPVEPLKACPQPGTALELRLDAKAFRENTVYDSGGDPIRLTANAERMERGADAIDALSEQAERLAAALEARDALLLKCVAFVEALTDNDLDEPIADNGMTVGGKLQYDAPGLAFEIRAMLAPPVCPVCNGDCASANPPVLNCPMKDRSLLASYRGGA